MITTIVRRSTQHAEGRDQSPAIVENKGMAIWTIGKSGALTEAVVPDVQDVRFVGNSATKLLVTRTGQDGETHMHVLDMPTCRFVARIDRADGLPRILTVSHDDAWLAAADSDSPRSGTTRRTSDIEIFCMRTGVRVASFRTLSRLVALRWHPSRYELIGVGAGGIYRFNYVEG